MQQSNADWAALEDKLVQLSNGHDRLVELIEQQRRAIRRADPAALAEVGLRIDAQVRDLAELESARRDCCHQLASRLGTAFASSQSPRLEAFCQRAGGRWARRLRLAAAQLSAQIERVRTAGRINLHVAGRLSDFCGELMGQVSRLSRDTGCYDARGRRTLASQPIVAGNFAAVG